MRIRAKMPAFLSFQKNNANPKKTTPFSCINNQAAILKKPGGKP